jgi:hypothetical protein
MPVPPAIARPAQPYAPAPSRPSQVCDAAHIQCPRCNELVRRFTAGPGSSIAVCDARPKPADWRPGDPTPPRCGQHLYVAGTEWGYANVFPISPAEFEYLTAVALGNPRQVLETLKVLRRRAVRAVPELPCRTCQTPRKTFDLYNGECRWCHEAHPAEASAA